jgi:inositol transport system substrate-binding protein
MKKALLVIAVVLMVTAGLFAGGGQAAGGGASSGPALVGYVCTNFNDTFQGYVMEQFKGYFTGKAGYTVETQDAQEDVVKQQDQVNNLIAKGAKAIVVVPVNTSATAPITKACQDAKIPLVYVNRNPFGDSNPPAGVYYVGSKEIDAGTFQGEEMGRRLNGQGGVCILMGKLDNEGAILRTQGNEEIFKSKYPGIKVLAKETANWQRDQGMSLTENYLTAYGSQLKGILGNNDEAALGAVEALRAAGRTDVLVMGVDATPDAIAAVENGSMAATVLQDHVGQGRGAGQAVENALTGKSQPAINWVPFVLITKENVAQYK